MPATDFTILGGDKRIAYIAPVLAARGYRITCFHTSSIPLENNPAICHVSSIKKALENTSVIIAGIPFAQNDLLYCEQESAPVHISQLQRYLRKHHKLFGGVIPDGFRKTCEERGIACYDFMSDEPLTLSNAVSTAEGAILEALKNKGTTLHRSDTLILGYGRCGRILTDKLRGLSAKVTVCSADHSELALALALGADSLPLAELASHIGKYEYIFNTIPACVLDRKCLEKITPSSLVIDIASNRSGADYTAARELGTPILFCPGLPGKYAPQSSAKHLTDYILNYCDLPVPEVISKSI